MDGVEREKVLMIALYIKYISLEIHPHSTPRSKRRTLSALLCMLVAMSDLLFLTLQGGLNQKAGLEPRLVRRRGCACFRGRCGCLRSRGLHRCQLRHQRGNVRRCSSCCCFFCRRCSSSSCCCCWQDHGGRAARVRSAVRNLESLRRGAARRGALLQLKQRPVGVL